MTTDPQPARMYAPHDHGDGMGRHSHSTECKHSSSVRNPRASDHTGVETMTWAEWQERHQKPAADREQTVRELAAERDRLRVVLGEILAASAVTPPRLNVPPPPSPPSGGRRQGLSDQEIRARAVDAAVRIVWAAPYEERGEVLGMAEMLAEYIRNGREVPDAG